MKRLLVAAALGAAAAAHAEDLVQVYRDGVAFDAQYLAARAQLDAGRERIPQARAGLLPIVSLSGNTTYNDAEAKFRGGGIPDSDRSFNSNGYQVTLAQPLFRWQNWIQFDQAKLQVAQSEALFENARQDLILRVAQAYFDVLLAQEDLRVVRVNKEAIAQQLEQAKKNFEVGVATITDTHEAQARYDLASAQEIAAQNELEVRRHVLRQITGKIYERLSPLRRGVEVLPPQPAEMQHWVDFAEKSNYQVQVQQAAFDIAEREIERNRAGHYPTLDVVATHGRNSTGASLSGVTAVGNEITSSTIGLQLAVPIYQGGAVSSRVREAEALKERARNDLESVRRTAALNARQAFLGVTSGLAQISALRAAVVSSQSALESNKLGYEVGVRINIDVLNAQQQLSATERDLARTARDTLLSQLRLKLAAGTLAEEDLQALNALLDK